jgi:HAD superfamily hydrolase (TIGR01509 family)
MIPPSDLLAPSPLETWPPEWSPAAVVLDCDGLLVDTEARGLALQEDYLARHGAALDEAARRALTGRPIEVVVTAIAEAVGKDPHRAGAELMAEHEERMSSPLEPLPGAARTVRAIAAVRPLAVASNSPRDLLAQTLDGLGLADAFDAAISLDDVAAAKPAPDLYLAAAAALGAAPGECLAVEDSETGAQAALAAGMQLIAVPSIPGQDPRAPRRLESLEDPVLAEWIAGWEGRR